MPGLGRRQTTPTKGTHHASRTLALTTIAFGVTTALAGNTAFGAKKPTLAPVKVMVTGTFESQAFNFPESVDGAQAAAKAVNDAGGIRGHKLEIVVCNDQFDPNVAKKCARDAVTQKVAAVTVGLSLLEQNVVPILEPQFEGRQGAGHSVDVPFVFDNLAAPSAQKLLGVDAPQVLADVLHGAWITFAECGVPAHPNLADWTRYDVETRSTMRFSEDSAVVRDPRRDERLLWTGIL